MISVLVVNLNNLEYTKNCINDLLKQDCNFDLTIVDQNSSESGTKEYFSSLPENVEFIQNYENKSLNHLWNWFVEKSQTTYVCLLNNDVRIAPNFLSSAIQILEKEPKVGFVNHVSNNKDYQEWSNELKYKIIEKPYRQGWDPIFRKECYSNIPEELSFFYGDDYIYSKLYSSGMKGAYVLNSPMIHFERSTTIEKGGQRDASPDGDFYHRLDLQFKNLSFVEELSKWKPEFYELKNSNLSRTYITHVTRDYLDVAINLAKSLSIFSNIPLVIYCVGLKDDDKKKFNQFKNIFLRNIDLQISSDITDYIYDESGNFYINRSSSRIYKILSAKTIAMQMALEEGWQEVCYLDSDCLATPLVDELFDWSTNISDFPLATEGIHEYMVVIENGKQRGNPFEFTWPIADNKLSLEWPLMSFMQMLPEQRGRYRTTGIMLMNQNCLSFIKTWRELCFLLPKLVDTNYYAPFHEETIYNVLSWKKENKGFPLCYINLGEGLESVKHLYSEDAKEGNLRWSDTDTSQNFYKIPDNKKYVKVLHGEKRPSEVDKILNFISDKKSEAKILVQIDTFPDTKEKIETTKYCIESLRCLGYPILLTSHIDIPEELKFLCDYSYTDSNNILLPPTGDINYFYYGNSSIYMRFKIDDIEAHSPSVITGWLNGAKFCKQNGFTHYLKVEYDFILDESSVDKLKNSIHQSSDSKEGFVLLRDNYIVPKIIFTSANLVNELNIDIKSYHDYFNYCYKFSVPDKLKRIAGVFTYHALINKFQRLNIFPSENENYFKTKFINLENAFLGFLSPLLGSDGEIYLCSYGLSNRFSEFKLLEDGVCVKNNNINFNKDVYSVTKININPDSKYELIYDNTTLEFKLVDILKNKFGTIKFN